MHIHGFLNYSTYMCSLLNSKFETILVVKIITQKWLKNIESCESKILL